MKSDVCYYFSHFTNLTHLKSLLESIPPKSLYEKNFINFHKRVKSNKYIFMGKNIKLNELNFDSLNVVFEIYDKKRQNFVILLTNQ
jgi:hypothetical protein